MGVASLFGFVLFCFSVVVFWLWHAVWVCWADAVFRSSLVICCVMCLDVVVGLRYGLFGGLWCGVAGLLPLLLDFRVGSDIAAMSWVSVDVVVCGCHYGMFNGVGFVVLICIFPPCFDLWCLACWFVCLGVLFVCCVGVIWLLLVGVGLSVLSLVWLNWCWVVWMVGCFELVGCLNCLW